MPRYRVRAEVEPGGSDIRGSPGNPKLLYSIRAGKASVAGGRAQMRRCCPARGYWGCGTNVKRVNLKLSIRLAGGLLGSLGSW